MDKKRIAFDIPWLTPSIQPSQMRTAIGKWLPGRGNVLFTILLVAGLFWVQNARALSVQQPAISSASGTIAYQGRLADGAGQPIAAATHPMVFRLYASDAADAVPLWTENWTGSSAVEVSDGLFNVMLGSLTPIPQSVITGNDSLYLGISVGSDDEMTPRIQLGTVPYAAQALTVPDGSISTAKLASGSVTQDKLDPTLDLVPSGAIIMWGGALGSVPTGWQLCDGSSGTPDLRDRFIVGAGSSYPVGATGGAAQVTLTIDQIPAHAHSYTDKYTTGERESGSHAWDATNDKDPRYSTSNKTTGGAGGGQAHENRPPYYALAFICKQ